MAVLFFLILFAVIAIETPVAIVFGGMAILPGILDTSFPYMVKAAICSMVNGLDNSMLLAASLFILSGIIMVKGGISEKPFNFFAYFTGSRTAGIPRVVIITCMLYGAISGSSPTTASVVGAMVIPLLISLGYDRVFSTSIMTVAGGLGVVIPPNISYTVYFSVSGASLSTLFIGGIIPGILIDIVLTICAYIRYRRNGEDKEKLAENYNRIHDMGFWNLFRESFAALLTPVITLGSTYGETASPTETAAVLATYVLVISIFIYKTLKINELGNLLVEGCKTYVTILFVIPAAAAFGRALTTLCYPQVISEEVLGSISDRIAVILVINLILLVLGMILDNIPDTMILTPIFLPMAAAIGIDPVHFDIMMTANLAISMAAPLMGINPYVADPMIKTPALKIARATIPFLISFFIALLLIASIPQLSLWLVGI